MYRKYSSGSPDHDIILQAVHDPVQLVRWDGSTNQSLSIGVDEESGHHGQQPTYGDGPHCVVDGVTWEGGKVKY